MSDWPDPPEILHQRDIWLIWKFDEREKKDGSTYWTKVPLDPDRAHEGDATDEDITVSFEEAVEAFGTHDVADGIGFAFPKDGLLVGTDLDDVRDPETGKLNQLGREVMTTLDSYTEVSPSGTGLHVVTLALKPGDRCKRKLSPKGERDGDECEIEMYGKKRFFTYTGDRVDASGFDTVEQRKAEIADVYDEYLASESGNDDGDWDGETPDLDLDDEEVLEKARNAANGDKFERLERGSDSAHGGDTSAADQAFVNYLAFYTGGDRSQIDRLFQASGRMRDKWLPENHSSYREQTIDTALSGRTEFYEPGGGTTTDGSERVEDDDSDDERELPTPESLSVNDGGYGYWKQHEDEPDEWVGLSNFQLETQSFATDPDDPNQKQIELTVHPAKGEAYDVTIPPTVFNEKREFKSEVVIGLTTTFSGKEKALNQLKTFVGTQDAPLRTGTYQMGRFGDEWVTPEGVLTTDGWSDDPGHIHIPRNVGAERKWDLAPEDGNEFDSDEVAEILELLPETRDAERFIPVIGWFWSSPFKPLIQEWTGQFNLLGVLGETGAGKSATLSVLWELFGMGGDPMTADDTKYVLLTTLASTNAIPMWFDEYKPSDMSDWAVDTFWNEVRKTTRGGVSGRGKPDGSTEEFHLNAPTVVSGEERVHGSAEERRGIYTTFKKSPTDPESESAQAFADLMGGSAKGDDGREYYDGHDLSQHALAYYQWALSLDDEEVQEEWRNSARHVSELLAEHDIDGMEDLVEQGLQTIKFGATLYRAFTDEMGGDAEALPNDAVDDAILYTATNAIGGANRKSHLDVLFEVAARAARHDYLEAGTHYKFVREGEADEEFRLNLSTGFDKIVQYGRDHDVAEDLLNSKDDYYERIGDALDAPDGYVAKKSQRSPPIGRAVGIYLRQATESIDDFDKSMFGDGDDEAEIEERIESAQTTVSPTAIADLDPGYQTVTVEAVSVSNDTPSVMDESGVLRDATGVIDYIVWDGAGPTNFEEGETYRIETAKRGTDPDGAPQLEIDMRLADIESVEAGVGYLDIEDSGGNERLSAATDGGEFEQTKPRMKELLREHGPCSDGEWFAKANEAGIDMDAAKGAFESLKAQGHVYELDGEWEVSD